MIYGLGAILYQENTIKDGRIVEANFNRFRLPQMREMPKVETVLVPTGGFWGGHGEPAILPLAPAVCNAVFAATGKRVRSLPLKHHDLQPGLSFRAGRREAQAIFCRSQPSAAAKGSALRGR